MLKKISYLLSLSFCLIVLSACDKQTDAKPTKASESITIINPTIRATPPGQKTTAMYMQLKNSSSTNHDLVKIEGDISSMIELHTHTHNDGVMQMGEVESMPISANSTAEAKSGGYHVMVMGLQKDLQLGDTFDFKFIFKDGSMIPVTAEVKTIELN